MNFFIKHKNFIFYSQIFYHLKSQSRLETLLHVSSIKIYTNEKPIIYIVYVAKEGAGGWVEQRQKKRDIFYYTLFINSFWFLKNVKLLFLNM